MSADRDRAITEKFAGIPVRDYAASLRWYRRLFGTEPAFHPNDVEAVSEPAAHRCAYILERSEHTGGSTTMVFVADLDATIAHIRSRGIEPVETETYGGPMADLWRCPQGDLP